MVCRWQAGPILETLYKVLVGLQIHRQELWHFPEMLLKRRDTFAQPAVLLKTWASVRMHGPVSDRDMLGRAVVGRRSLRRVDN